MHDTFAVPVALPRLELPERVRWSVGDHSAAAVAASQAGSGLATREVVVVVPFWADPLEGFELVRRYLEAGDPRLLRVAARGATRRESWPAWVPGVLDRVILTELDAYLPLDKAPVAQELLEPVGPWIDRLFEGVLPGVERALFASVTNRVLQPMVDAWPLVRGLGQEHAGDEIVCTRADWAGLESLAALIAPSGGRVLPAPRAPGRLSYGGSLIGWVLGGIAATIGRRVSEYWVERPSRARVRALRSRAPRAARSPSVWLGVIGDWPWSSRHVLEGVLPALGSHEPVGVLLQSSLRPGLRERSDATASVEGPIFPALDHPLLGDRLTAVDQVVSAESASELAGSLARSTLHALRLLGRLLAAGAVVRLGPVQVSLRRQLPELARLITIDVFRSREALEATQRLLARHAMTGARVIWSHASLANFAVPDVALQAAGATTIDLVHGGLADYVDHLGKDRTACSVKALWTVREAEGLAPYLSAQHCVGPYVPRALPPRDSARRLDGPLRILLLTNYVNGYTTVAGRGRLTYECYQSAFFDAVREAVGALRRPVELRWRPHPADDAASLRRNLALNPSVVRSTGTLHEDLSWATVALTSVSSIIVEALAHPIPLFVHTVPCWDYTVAIAPFEPSRRFHDGAELAAGLRAAADALDRGAADACAPEDALRERLFGPLRRPRPVSDLFAPVAALEVVS